MKKIRIIILFFVLIMIRKEEVFAKATREEIIEAKEAYRDYLDELTEDAEERGYTLDYNKFALIDINNDKIPEFVYALYDSEHIKICTYSNGSVNEIISTGLGTTMKIYPNKKLIRMKGVHCGQFYDYYYKFNGKESILLTEKEGDECINVITGKTKKTIKPNVYSPYLYKINGKKVSKNKYEKYLKKKTKGAKKKNLKMLDINDYNLERYLN